MVKLSKSLHPNKHVFHMYSIQYVNWIILAWKQKFTLHGNLQMIVPSKKLPVGNSGTKGPKLNPFYGKTKKSIRMEPIKMWHCVEPVISLHSYTVSLVQWSTRLLRHEGPGFNPQGVVMWNRDSPVSIVLLHWWPWHDWSLWPCLRRASSRTVTRLLYRHCDNPT
jgi:hypothetical protein